MSISLQSIGGDIDPKIILALEKMLSKLPADTIVSTAVTEEDNTNGQGNAKSGLEFSEDKVDEALSKMLSKLPAGTKVSHAKKIKTLKNEPSSG